MHNRKHISIKVSIIAFFMYTLYSGVFNEFVNCENHKCSYMKHGIMQSGYSYQIMEKHIFLPIYITQPAIFHNCR